MKQQIATLVTLSGILWLFALARDKNARTSLALWIPILWLMICFSRNPAEWMQLSAPRQDADRYMEGNPIDRNFLSMLIAFALMTLLARGQRTLAAIKSNWPILLYFSYCVTSVLWSDFPDVAFRRLFRALGDIVMVFVILTDLNPMAAFRRVLTRIGFVLIPLSVLFIRYYPELGRIYDRSGRMLWTGVAGEKNALGMLCLIFGLSSVWHLIQVWKGKTETLGSRPLVAHGVLLAMVVFLLIEVDSATAVACFFLAGGVMALTSWPKFARKPGAVHLLVAGLLLFIFSALFLTTSDLVGVLGRDSTLTGRTEIWRLALGMTVDPLLGAGYESFWLGDRLQKMWSIYYNHINHAHNGYIEIFLNLGWFGLAFLVVIIVKGYAAIIAAINRQEETGALRLAFWVVTLLSNITEAAFKAMHPAWGILLLSAFVVPLPAPARRLAGVPLVPKRVPLTSPPGRLSPSGNR